MAGKESGAAGGAIKGATVGASFGPIGAVVGGVIGGVMGAIGGGYADEARKYANRAKKTQRVMSQLEAAVQRRDLIRNARIARAESLAAGTSEGTGGLLSSAPMGALSSLGSQTNFNIRYFDSRIRDYLAMQAWVDKAGKYAKKASDMNSYMDMAASAVSLMGSFKTPTPSQAGTPATQITLGSGAPSSNYGVQNIYGR